MRLGDLDALRQRVKGSTASRTVKVLAEVLINTAPTIDAVPVVRCRKCKRSAVHNGELFCLYTQDVTPLDGYCYRGEADFIRRQQHDL